MDNLCHTLLGAAIGEAGLKSRTRFGSAALLIAANLPDLDALVFATRTPSVAFRRGWTHGVLAQALLPVALTAAILAFHRLSRHRAAGSPPRAGALLALSCIGVLSHVGLDWLNNYGIRLLMPFSGRWFYGDSVFIIDLWLWLVLGAGVTWARRNRSPSAARVSLAVAALYVAGMVWSSSAARTRVIELWRLAPGTPPSGLMVGAFPSIPCARSSSSRRGTTTERASSPGGRGGSRWIRRAFPSVTARMRSYAPSPTSGSARCSPGAASRTTRWREHRAASASPSATCASARGWDRPRYSCRMSGGWETDQLRDGRGCPGA